MNTIRQGLAARMLLATIGGLAAMVAGSTGNYIADKQTPKRGKGSGRNGRQRSGLNTGMHSKILRSHFDSKGICWSAKKNKIKRAYGELYVSGVRSQHFYHIRKAT
jgi:hypothetical protein